MKKFLSIAAFLFAAYFIYAEYSKMSSLSEALDLIKKENIQLKAEKAKLLEEIEKSIKKKD